jgi:hypothetical protein
MVFMHIPEIVFQHQIFMVAGNEADPASGIPGLFFQLVHEPRYAIVVAAAIHHVAQNDKAVRSVTPIQLPIHDPVSFQHGCESVEPSVKIGDDKGLFGLRDTPRMIRIFVKSELEGYVGPFPCRIIAKFEIVGSVDDHGVERISDGSRRNDPDALSVAEDVHISISADDGRGIHVYGTIRCGATKFYGDYPHEYE